jgi:hypothetical protein
VWQSFQQAKQFWAPTIRKAGGNRGDMAPVQVGRVRTDPLFMIGEQVAQTAIFYKRPEALPPKCLCVVTAATPGERDSYLGPRGRYKPDWTARECR